MRLKSLKIILKSILYFSLIFFTVSIMFFGCASIQQPMGGPKDTIPPKVVKETPKNLTRNFKTNEIQIQFDEFFKLNNEFQEVSISPAMDQLPVLKIKRNVLNVKLPDTLDKNTTYTINFGNAIVDYNEGNILKNYSYVFSTGNVIDSLTISGKVINAITKQPEEDATVFIIPVKQDSIFGKKRASIFTATDTAGIFSLTHLRSDTYRIYALKEKDGGDRIYNSTKEGIAFKKDSLVLRKDTTGILLETFNEEPAEVRTINRKIDNDGRIFLSYNKSIKNPSLKILQPADLDSIKLVEFNKSADTAQMWLPGMNFDSLAIATRTGHTNIDTAVLRRSKRDTYDQSITVNDNLNSGVLKPGNDLILTLSAPVTNFDATKIKLLEDSVARGAAIIKDTSSFRKYIIRYHWREEKQYILDLAENAFTNSWGGKSKATKKNFTLDTEENYGNLTLDITIPDTNRYYIVQLLKNEGEILRNDVVKSNSKINYNTYPGGSYFIRIIYDDNKNGKWDTGNVKEKRQPEDVWNYNKEITLRANWDLEEKITIPPEDTSQST